MKKPPHDHSASLLLDRRSVLALAAGSLATTVATGASKAARAAQLDPARPENAWQIHRKLRLRTDSGLVFWWIRGPSFGQVGADLTPLYSLNYGLVQRVTQQIEAADQGQRSLGGSGEAVRMGTAATILLPQISHPGRSRVGRGRSRPGRRAFRRRLKFLCARLHLRPPPAWLECCVTA